MGILTRSTHTLPWARDIYLIHHDFEDTGLFKSKPRIILCLAGQYTRRKGFGLGLILIIPVLLSAYFVKFQ